MTSFQKIIKYGAIAFAIYLCIMIIGIIISVFTSVFGIFIGLEIFGDYDNNIITKWEQEYSNITNIDINLSACKLNIKKGDSLKVEATDVSDNFNCKVEDKKLKIEDKKWNKIFLNMDNLNPEVTIYIPENMKFDNIKMETGINDTKIELLKANTIELKMGIGKYQIDKIYAKNAKIKSGTGEASIDNAEFEELKLDSGIGKLVLNTKVTKTADIDCGLGNVELNLIGKVSDYRIKTHTGIGNCKVEGKKVNDNETIGTGDVLIKIDAGVGETDLQFVGKE